MTLLYTSDNTSTGFETTSIGTTPTGWTSIVGTWNVQALNPPPGRTHTLSDTTKTGNDIVVANGVTAAADMEMLFAQQLDATDFTSPNLVSTTSPFVRCDSGLNNGYLVAYDNTSNVLDVFKRVGGSFSLIGSASKTITYSVGLILYYRFQAIGTTLNFRVWPSTQQEPTTWDGTVTDSSISAAGFGGFYNGGQAGASITGSAVCINSLTSSQLMTVRSPAVSVVAGTMTVTGTYTGTAPTALNYAVDGGAFTAVSSPTISGGSYSFTVTSPAIGLHTVHVQNATTTTITASGIFLFTTSNVAIAPNNSGIVYSPYNWNVSATDAITPNSGAYFKTLFTGTSCTLNFNVSNNLTPLSQIWTRVDNGPWTQANVASTVSLTIPAITLNNPDVPYHRLDVYVKSTTSTQNRWNTPSNTAVDFTGLTLSAGSVVSAPVKFPKNIIFYGDSITEGLRTLGEAQANDVDNSDAVFCWTYEVGELLGAEIGNIGFGGQSYLNVAPGNVPPLPNAYNFIYQGVSRSFSPMPNLIVNNMGTNDQGSNTTAAATTVINGLLAACPGVPQAILEPFPAVQGGQQTPFLQAAVAACNTPSLVTFVHTTGFFNTAFGADSSTLHPSGPNGTYLVAPQVASVLLPILNRKTGGTSTFSG